MRRLCFAQTADPVGFYVERKIECVDLYLFNACTLACLGRTQFEQPPRPFEGELAVSTKSSSISENLFDLLLYYFSKLSNTVSRTPVAYMP